MSVKVEQPLLSLQYLQVNAHDPDKLRSTITNEAFILNDKAQLRIHESNLQAFNMSFILKIKANTILIRKMIHFCLAEYIANLTHTSHITVNSFQV